MLLLCGAQNLKMKLYYAHLLPINCAHTKECKRRGISSTGLQDAEMKYLAIDKQAFAVFKTVKHFRPYLLRSHTKIIVSHSAVRELLIQKEP